jgi:hypothetical protein
MDDYECRFIDQPNGWLGGTPQPPASFNMDAVKAQVVRAIRADHSA